MEDDKIREQLNLPPENPTEAPTIPQEPVQPLNNNIEQVPMEPQYEEPKKRKLRRGTIPKLILSVILFVAGVALIIWSIRYEEPADNPPENNTTIDDNQTAEDGIRAIYIGSNEEDGNSIMSAYIFREDNTFVYETNINAEHPTPKVGTYSVINGNITIEEVVSYGSDTCYYTKDDKDIVFNTYTGTINDLSLDIVVDGQTVTYTKSSSDDNLYSKYNENWYVINPIDGASPENSTNIDQWTKCDNIEN